MDITISPGKLSGQIAMIPSKSQAHRLLICAAFADRPTQLICPDTSRDIEATADCLRALGAKIHRTDEAYTVIPVQKVPEKAQLHCCESGSTLRFMLPIVGALGIDGTFIMEGRLPYRPLSPLWEEMERMGCKLSRPTETTLRCIGKLIHGEYQIDGGVSSQFISGLMFAHWLMGGCSLSVTGQLESRPYVDMTAGAIAMFDGHRTPGNLTVEGDWSNGAFWLAAMDLGNNLEISGLDPMSSQGDKAISDCIRLLRQEKATISAKDIPDLVPILSVVAASHHGAVFTDIQRLRLKESDRVASTIAMLKALGADAYADDDALTVLPNTFHGGTVDSVNDHRIAMSAAIAATVSTSPVTIQGAECVQKSYPKFWEEYRRLGGNI